VASTLNDLGLLLKQRGDLAAAEPLFRESLKIQRKSLGDEHADVAQGPNNLAGVLQKTRATWRFASSCAISC